jgi:adenosylhomocysteine nucleosidase
MLFVTFALPQESRDFRRAVRAAGARMGGEEIRVAHLGVGPVAAATSVTRLLSEKPRGLICAGFAGGLDARLKTADLLIADNFSTPELRARALALTGQAPHRFFGTLVSRDAPVESVAAKAALAHETGALAVDMETAAVAQACRAAQMPLLAVRAISDPASMALPVPFAEWFDLQRQRPRRFGLLKYLARHPDRVGPFADFLRGLAPARRALTDFLGRFLQHRA